MAEWILRGREHHALAAIALLAEAEAAIALSRGGAPKLYAHTDPNEDVALLQVQGAGTLLAVADGHGGFEAAEIAVETVCSWGRTLPDRIGGGSEWKRLALQVFARANERIREHASHGGRRLSRTTLTLALVDPTYDGVRWASIGDSHVFHAANGVLDLAHAHGHDHPREGKIHFLGFADETEESLAEKCRVGEERVSGAQAIVLATDGLSERGVGVDEPEDTVAEAVQAAAQLPPAERAAALARSVVEAALAAHKKRRSGDNVAAAAAWLGPLKAR
jgi:serine/threonine protein phosphatase PrpC